MFFRTDKQRQDWDPRIQSTHSPCLPFILCSLQQIGLHVIKALWSSREKVSRCRSWNFALVTPTRYSCIAIYVDCTGSQNLYALALHQHTWSFKTPFKHLNLQRWHSMEYYILYWEKLGAETQSHLHNKIEIISLNVPFEAGNITINFQVRNKHSQ